MAGGFGKPYRDPCWGWPAGRKKYAGCYQHRKAAEDGLGARANTTKVADYRDEGDPEYSAGGIAPYLRQALSLAAGGDCPGPTNMGCVEHGPKCGPWTVEELISGTVESGFNTYAGASGTEDRSRCRKLGFKNVQGRRVWHGALPWDAEEHCAAHESLDAGCNNCQFMAEQTTAQQTKYRRVKYEGRASVYGYDPDVCTGSLISTTTASVERTYEVDYESGVIAEVSAEDVDEFDDPSVLEGLKLDTASLPYCWNLPPTIDSVNTIYGLEIRGAGTFTGHDGNGVGICEVVVERSATVFHWTVKVYEACYNTGWYRGPLTQDWEVTITLSEASTAEALQADLFGLMGNWDLADDALYPWRLDGFTGVAPLVLRNEVETEIDPTDMGIMAVDYVDSNGEVYDGTIRGVPNVAGSASHFDFFHRTWGQCSEGWYVVGYGAWSGQTNAGDVTDAAMPKSATCWTENYVGDTHFPAGAWLKYTGTNGVLYGQKWAEIKVPRPSINFARPCGEDRWALDWPTARCVVSVNWTDGLGTVKLLEETTIETGDLCYAKADGVDGHYTVTKVDGTHYELTTAKVWDPVAPARSDPGMGILAKLRWTTAPAICGRLTVADCYGVDGAGLIRVETVEAHGLRTGDSVVVSDVSGPLDANGTWTVTVVNNREFTLDGSWSDEVWTGGGWVAAPAGADYWWNDDQAKGDFLYVVWDYDHRDWQERERVIAQYAACNECEEAAPESLDVIRAYQAGHGMPRGVATFSVAERCLAFTVCDPQVMAISPNGETWENGVTEVMLGIALDCKYGSDWQGLHVQHLADPFWEEPFVDGDGVRHGPCLLDESEEAVIAADFVEDDGSCALDTEAAWYYARRPYVEARMQVPAIDEVDAPSPPEGRFTILGLEDLDTPAGVDGLILAPPVGPEYQPEGGGLGACLPMPTETPWGIYWLQMLCTCGEGRFAVEYGANGVRVNCP